jgi:glycosyltransferase involved in cell wall biosynthesis
MPTYNRATLIVETINSIRLQTYTSWELIIVDDGSNDNTEELIKNIADKRIQFHKTGRTGSIIQLRMKGIAFASGELIAFMDSDDLWAPEKLQKQIEAFTPDTGFSLTGGYNFRESNQPLAFFYKQKNGIRYGKVLTAFFRSEVAMIFPSLVLRKQCIDKLKAAQQCSFVSDVDFLIALAVHFKAVVLYEPLLYRRLHEANTSSDDWVKGYVKKIVVITSSKAQKIISSSLAREALFKLYINFGEDYLLRRLQRKAIEQFLNAWKNRPFSIIPLKKTGKAVLSFLRHV